LINELTGVVDVFGIENGNFKLLQTLAADTARSSNKGSADIHISPNGKWLLTSNRVSSNEVTVFAIQKNGRLEKVYHQPVANMPRNFSFDPTGKFVFVASQKENRIQVFSFDDQIGRMKDTKQDIFVKAPVCLVFTASEAAVDPEERIRTLNIQLIPPVAPVANYVKFVQVGNTVYLSGHGPDKPGGGQVYGKLGKDLTVEQGKEAARLTGISLISTLKGYLGNLNKVKRVVKVLGLVNSDSEFGQQPAVMNGFSDLMVDVFGSRGKHARSSVGVNALPNNIAVEIEMIVELK
jgi:enamine deaminase RidA (YjgF/YER057c/UK114 family)